MDGNFFFVVGILLVIAAVGLAFLGIRESDRFPPSRGLMVGVIALFVVIVGTTMAFAIVKSKDEQDKRNAELAKEEPQPANTGQNAPPPATPGGQPQEAGSGGTTLQISTPSGTELAYNQKQVSAPAGNVTIDFQNNEPIEHDVAVADSSGKVLGQTELVTSGSASTSIDLPAGNYVFYCTVPGHREAGMQGTLAATGGTQPAAGGAKKK